MPLPLPLALLIVLAGEATLIPGIRRRFPRTRQDRGTAWVLGVLIAAGGAVALALMAATPDHPSWALSDAATWAGLPLAAAGTALRAWAVRLLGRRFTLTVQVGEGHPLVDRGPYRWIRHPAYLGNDVAFVGLGLATGCWPAIPALVVPIVAGHVLRIRAEEAALEAVLGDRWRAWRDRTWRLLPFVW